MAWIESHQGLRSHPKTRKLVRRLNASPAIIVGHLHFIWWWALDFAQDGEITQFDPEDISDACDWDGEPEEFFNALVEVGFIDKVDDRYFLHDWYDYAGKLIEIRRKDAERKRKSRGQAKESEGSPTDIRRTSERRRTESIRDLNPNLNHNLNQHQEQGAGGAENPYTVFQNEIGVISSAMSQMLQDSVEEYGDQMVIDAIREAVRQNVRKFAYIDSILKRWKTEGRDRKKKTENVMTMEEWKAHEQRKKEEASQRAAEI